MIARPARDVNPVFAVLAKTGGFAKVPGRGGRGSGSLPGWEAKNGRPPNTGDRLIDHMTYSTVRSAVSTVRSLNSRIASRPGTGPMAYGSCSVRSIRSAETMWSYA